LIEGFILIFLLLLLFLVDSEHLSSTRYKKPRKFCHSTTHFVHSGSLCHKLLKRKEEMVEEFDDNGWISSITVEGIVFQLVSTLVIGNNKHELIKPA